MIKMTGKIPCDNNALPENRTAPERFVARLRRKTSRQNSFIAGSSSP
jgi:hypothetical protein